MKFDIVYAAIEKRIMTYHLGARLPSENTFAIEFGVARMTVRRALAQFKENGLIESIKGKGYFVIKLPVSSVVNPFHFIEISPQINGYKILHFEVIIATFNLSQHIKCQVGDKLFLIKKQLYSAEKVKIVIEQYIPFYRFPTLSIQDISHNDILIPYIQQSTIEHIVYRIKFKPLKAELELNKRLDISHEHIVQQVFITAQSSDDTLLYFTTINYDPTQINISFNHQR